LVSPMALIILQNLYFKTVTISINGVAEESLIPIIETIEVFNNSSSRGIIQ